MNRTDAIALIAQQAADALKGADQARSATPWNRTYIARQEARHAASLSFLKLLVSMDDESPPVEQAGCECSVCRSLVPETSPAGPETDFTLPGKYRKVSVGGPRAGQVGKAFYTVHPDGRVGYTNRRDETYLDAKREFARARTTAMYQKFV